MNKNFTPEDLLRFLYHETSREESQEIKAALRTDPYLAKIYHLLRSETNDLDNLEIAEPSESSIQIVLQHSRSIHNVEHIA